MNALKHFKIVLFLICVSQSLTEAKKYPRIQDVVSFAPDSQYIPCAIEKIRSGLDVRTYRRNMALFRKLVRGNLDTVLFGKEPNRRAYEYLEIYKQGNRPEKHKAQNYQFRTKIVDCMLQLVYMARHFLKAFERHEYMDKTTLAYRIGYVCKKMRILFKKCIAILEYLNIKQRNRIWWYRQSPRGPLVLHHKVVKMNVDFEYYYAVLKRLHAKNVPYEPPQWHLHVYQLPTSMDQYG